MPRLPTLAALLLVIATSASAADASADLFLPKDALDLTLLLAPPPADDSAATKSELAEIHRTQAAASDADKKQAVADHEEDVFVFGSVLGSAFTAAHLPVATPFFARVRHAEGEFVNPAKKAWNRPRPPLVDPTITPCEKLSGSASYPSGHSTSGYLLAIVLSQMVPEKRDAIFQRVAEYAHNRVVCGVHYPSDVEAGKISGTVIAATLGANPAYRIEFGQARAEVRKLLGLPAN